MRIARRTSASSRGGDAPPRGRAWFTTHSVSTGRADHEAETPHTVHFFRNRLEQPDGLRRGRALHGMAGRATLSEFAQLHLVAKATRGRFTDLWLAVTEQYLTRAVEFFGAKRELASITVADVRQWTAELLGTRNGRSGTLSASSVRQHLGCLSNLYRRARAERLVPSGYNPIGDFDEKPSFVRREARWLEIRDAALFLEAARSYRPPPSRSGPRPVPFA